MAKANKGTRPPTETGRLASAMRRRALDVSPAVIEAIKPKEKGPRRLRLRGRTKPDTE